MAKGGITVTNRAMKGSTGVEVVTIELASGVTLKLMVTAHGFVRLDHERTNGIADKRTILEGVVTEKKRTFSVYSTSGYANHYKGKPVDPTSAPTAATSDESSSGSGTTTATGASGGSAKSAAAPATTTGPSPVLSPATAEVGQAVVRSDGDTGKVTGTGKDAVGAYVEVEWNDHGYESMYEAELKAHEVRPTAAPAAEASTSASTPKAGASTGGDAAASTGSTTRKARKKTTAKTTAKGKAVKKASHTHDALAELVESVRR